MLITNLAECQDEKTLYTWFCSAFLREYSGRNYPAIYIFSDGGNWVDHFDNIQINYILYVFLFMDFQPNHKIATWWNLDIRHNEMFIFLQFRRRINFKNSHMFLLKQGIFCEVHSVKCECLVHKQIKSTYLEIRARVICFGLCRCGNNHERNEEKWFLKHFLFRFLKGGGLEIIKKKSMVSYNLKRIRFSTKKSK